MIIELVSRLFVVVVCLLFLFSSKLRDCNFLLVLRTNDDDEETKMCVHTDSIHPVS